MQKLSITIAGIALIALGTVSVEPVQAALLDFNFSTDSGATGTLLIRDNLTNLSVASRQVPESNNRFGILAGGIGGALLLLKRNSNTKESKAFM